MDTIEDIENLEKLIGQLDGLHAEIAQLSKKSPNDGLNLFKLRFVNKILKLANSILTGRYRPFDDFEQFDEEALPTNSDVTMILTQYIEQVERFRSDNVVEYDYEWRYVIDGQPSEFESKPPTIVGQQK